MVQSSDVDQELILLRQIVELLYAHLYSGTLPIRDDELMVAVSAWEQMKIERGKCNVLP